jgi:uncharacterized membrane protein YccC
MHSTYAEISTACLKHLQREEEALRAKLEMLRQVHEALVHGEIDSLEQLNQSQDEAARTTQELLAEREHFRSHVGQLLQLPSESVTVRQVLALLPEKESKPVREVWSRLLELTAEMDRTNRGITGVIEYCLGFTQRYLLDITGGGQPAECYSPTGTQQEASCGSFLEARG